MISFRTNTENNGNAEKVHSLSIIMIPMACVFVLIIAAIIFYGIFYAFTQQPNTATSGIDQSNKCFRKDRKEI